MSLTWRNDRGRMSLRKKEVLGKGSFGISTKDNRRSVVVKTYLLPSKKPEAVKTFREQYNDLIATFKNMKYIMDVRPVRLTTNTRLQLVTEFLQYSLPSFVELQDLEPKIYLEDAVEIALQVSQALMFLHNPSEPEGRRVVVHRHLSPNNILISVDESEQLHVKVADAGLAQTIDSCFGLMVTVNDERSRYIAPELVGNICNRQQSSKYRPAVDIFSLGMILLEMCLGHPPDPIQGEEQDQVKEVYDMSDDHPLKQLLISCLSITPDKRIVAGEIAQRLTQDDLKNEVIHYDFRTSKDLFISQYEDWKAVRTRVIAALEQRNLTNDIKRINKIHTRSLIPVTSGSKRDVIDIMLRREVFTATGGLKAVQAQGIDTVMQDTELRQVNEELAEDIKATQSMCKRLKKFDQLIERNVKRYIIKDQVKPEAECYRSLQNLADLPEFQEFVTNAALAEENVSEILSLFTCFSVECGIPEAAQIATNAPKTCPKTRRVAYLSEGIMAAVIIPIDIYFICASLEALKRESVEDAARTFREMKEKMVRNEVVPENLVKEYIQLKARQAFKERRLQNGRGGGDEGKGERKVIEEVEEDEKEKKNRPQKGKGDAKGQEEEVAAAVDEYWKRKKKKNEKENGKNKEREMVKDEKGEEETKEETKEEDE